MSIEKINQSTSSFIKKLTTHQLYSKIKTIKDLRKFTEYHVFAVWDFMSLLKSLQNNLTCTSIPWLPNKNSQVAYLINEIVLAEETDLNQFGNRKSHYELYIDAIKCFGAKTNLIENFILNIKNNNIFEAINTSDLPLEIKDFMTFNFKIIEEGKSHKIAAAFTFGRENLIPNMFTKILNSLQKNFPSQDISQLIYYFERHIELDEDKHSPMALQMIIELAENIPNKWKEIEEVSIQSLKKRITLWDAIENNIVLS
jgi:hypothetical protein